MKHLKKAAAIGVAVACVFAAGCNSGKTVSESKFTTTGEYPMNTDVELRVWQRFTPKNFLSSMNDSNFRKYLAEATGVNFTIESPPVGSEEESFNLMLASDNMPDIIMYGGWRQPKAGEWLDSGAITALDEYINGGVMPNLKKVFDDNKDYKKLAETLDGRMFYAPMFLGDDILRSYKTYIIRQDLLEKAGMESPVTIDDWEKVLAKFKDMGIKTPLTLDITSSSLREGSMFLSCFDIIADFYQENGKVKFGMSEKAFGEWIRKMNSWYKNGLLDKEFTDQTSSRISQLVTTGECGALYGNVGGGLGTYISAIKPDSGIKLAPAKVPSSSADEKAMYNQTQFKVHSAGAVISGTCKNKEIAARFIDFGYSEEGQLIWNFGKEGESYTWAEDKNGERYPKYKDILTDPAKRPEGASIGQALSMYANVGNPVSIQSKWYLLQVNNTPEQRLALEYANDTRCDDYLLPPILFGTNDFSEVNDKMMAIYTYIDEAVAKLITGRKELESGIAEYYATLEKMGINEVKAEYQKAYDAYLKR